MSGGVDSAVSAYLLKQKGCKVVGAFVKAWEPEFLPCTGTRDRLEAMRVAAHLGIPFVTYDLGDIYKREVVDPFIREYKAGRTPNPDVLCNRAIKFGAFWERAQADGADYIATGHYAQIKEAYSGQRTVDSQRSSLNAIRYTLNTSRDSAKDQTYFLWTLTQGDLVHALFPVGGLLKSEVREIARRSGLPNAARKDSQGLCFLGHVDMRSFLKRYLPVQAGMIYHTSGTPLGEHEGAWFYTVGEHISLGGSGVRRYIVAKDVAKNELIVSEAPMRDVGRLSCTLADISWVREVPDARKTYDVQTRYHGPHNKARIVENTVTFDVPTLAVPGQSLVVYDPQTGECMGGGIIG